MRPPDNAPSEGTTIGYGAQDAEAIRQRARRWVLLAGAMTLSALCGAALLLYLLLRIVLPATTQRATDSPRELYKAVLWCPSCQEQGLPIVLWADTGGGFFQEGEAGELAHGTAVTVLRERRSSIDGRIFVQVSAEGQTGWVPASLVRR
ncbi:MAG: hypothetical protein JXA09_14415 [Anaerolineae bacterium]|nr:hypothetical protein [Anaerolineae bacterium]